MEVASPLGNSELEPLAVVADEEGSPEAPKEVVVRAEDAPMMLDVVAPATLIEGYQLEVDVGGTCVTVIVPPGGVEQGQRFMAAVAGQDSTTNSSSRNRFNNSVPVGAWRDGLFNCCKYGFFHPLFWVAFCFTPVVLAQVQYRLRLGADGQPASRGKAERAFYTLLFVFFCWYVERGLAFLVEYLAANESLYSEYDQYDIHYIHYQKSWQSIIFEGLATNPMQCAIDLFYTIYILVLIARVRKFVRSKYAIPPVCGSFDDCCCSIFCSCCAVSQMARHTADYDTYAAICCSKSGLPPHVPEIV